MFVLCQADIGMIGAEVYCEMGISEVTSYNGKETYDGSDVPATPPQAIFKIISTLNSSQST